MSLYIDANVFILAAIGIGKKAINAQSVLKKIIKGEYTAMTSSLTVDEVVWSILKQTKDRKTAIEQGLRILQFDSIKILSVDGITMKKSLGLMQKYPSLKPRDAIHAVIALNVGALTMLSDDSDFDVLKEIKRKNLD